MRLDTTWAQSTYMLSIRSIVYSADRHLERTVLYLKKDDVQLIRNNFRLLLSSSVWWRCVIDFERKGSASLMHFLTHRDK